jgi:hypothetical protein
VTARGEAISIIAKTKNRKLQQQEQHREMPITSSTPAQIRPPNRTTAKDGCEDTIIVFNPTNEIITHQEHIGMTIRHLEHMVKDLQKENPTAVRGGSELFYERHSDKLRSDPHELQLWSSPPQRTIIKSKASMAPKA